MPLSIESSSVVRMSTNHGNLSQPMLNLKSIIENIGCSFCFASTGKRFHHFLSKCPKLKGKCRKCFNGLHTVCPLKDSIPHNLRVCFYCGLDPELHLPDTFGKPTCQTWASDKLIAVSYTHLTLPTN
jgi:hypothetical protein